MKVKELIEQLSKFDGELPVCIHEIYIENDESPPWKSVYNEVSWLESVTSEYVNENFEKNTTNFIALYI